MSNLHFVSRLVKTKFVIALMLFANTIWALDSDPNPALQQYFVFASNNLNIIGSSTTPTTGYWGAGGNMTQGAWDTVVFNTELRVKGNFYGGNPLADHATKGYKDWVRVKGTPSGKTPPQLENPGVFADPTLPTWTAAQILTSIGGSMGTNKDYGWTPTTTTLAPGNYGNLVLMDASSKITLGAGDYYFNNVTLGGTIEIDNNGTTPTRIIIQGNFDMQNTGGATYVTPKILAKTSASLGKTLVYVAGTTVNIPSGATNTSGQKIYTQVDASVIAPFATVDIRSEVKFNGQVAAQNINIANNFDGGVSTFVAFSLDAQQKVKDVNEGVIWKETLKINGTPFSTGDKFTFSAPTGVDATFFETPILLGNDSVVVTMKAAAIYENAAGQKVDANKDAIFEMTFNVNDSKGTIPVPISVTVKNINDEIPQAITDNLSVYERSNAKIKVTANDSDTTDKMTLNGTVKLLASKGANGGAKRGTAIFASDTLIYTAPAIDFKALGASSVMDTVWYTLDDGGVVGKDTADGFVVVTINDAQDAPRLDRDSATLNENETKTGTMVVIDPDYGDVHTFSAPVKTAKNGTFAFTNANTGAWTYTNVNAGTEDQSDTVLISVRDQGNKSDTALLIFKINRIADEKATATVKPVTIPETSVLDSKFLWASAIGDLDIGLGVAHTVTIRSIKDGTTNYPGLFTLSNDSLLVLKDITTINQDQATPLSGVTVTVRIADTDDPTVVYQDFVVAVNFTAVDEFKPDLSNATTTVNENSPAATQVYDLATMGLTDGDREALNAVFTPIKGDTAKYEKIGNLIKVKVGANLDYETDPADTLWIEVQTGSGPLKDTALLVINLVNLPDAAITFNNQKDTVFENSAEALTAITAVSTESGETFTYSISAGPDSAYVTINSQTGVVSIKAPGVDYEQKQSISFVVKATSSADVTRDKTANYDVVIKARNDNAVVFNSDTIDISEGTYTNPTIVPFRKATDADLQLGDSLVYNLVSTSDSRFVFMNGDVHIKAGSVFDFDNADKNGVYTLVIRANDSTELAAGDVAHPDTMTFTIRLKGVNDKGPRIDPVGALSVAENVKGASLTTINAVDGDGDAVSYSVKNTRYVINATTGVLNLASAASYDYETEKTARVWVYATSNASVNGTVTPVIDSIEVIVNIKDTNEAPVFANTAVPSATEAKAWTLTASAKDEDANDQGKLAYTLSGTAPSGMTIDASTGLIAWTPAQGQTSVDFNVYVMDDGWDAQGKLSDTLNIKFSVTSVNDSAIFNIGALFAREDSVFAYTLSATDKETSADQLVYTLDGTLPADANGLAITSTGLVTWTPSKEYAQRWTVVVPVKVTDKGDGSAPAISVKRDMVIEVRPINDRPKLKLDTITVVEKLIVVDTLSKKMTDLDPTDGHNYRVINNVSGTNIIGSSSTNTALFSWTSGSTKTIFVQPVQIEVCDKSPILNPALASDTASLCDTSTLYIKVLPKNDPPKITVPGDTILDEDQNLVINGITVFDEDMNDADQLVVWGKSSDANIVQDAQISVTSKGLTRSSTIYPVKDANGVVYLYYTVRDDSSSTAMDTIRVTYRPVNDAPVLADTSMSIDENSEIGTLVGTIRGTDVDKDVLYYTQLNSSKAFTVVRDGRVLVLDKTAMDYENLKSDTLVVRVDDGGLADTAKVIINLKDIMEKTWIAMDSVVSTDGTQKWLTTRDTTITSLITFTNSSPTAIQSSKNQIWTNQTSVKVYLKLDGVQKDTTVTVEQQYITAKYGTQNVKYFYKNPTKNTADSIEFKLHFNTMVPVLAIDTSSIKLPKDTAKVLYMNKKVWDLTQGKLPWKVEKVDTLPGKWSKVDTLVQTVLNEGKVSTIVVKYTDSYGNTSLDTVKMYLDTVAPSVAIVSPRGPKGADTVQLYSLFIPKLDWTVDGALQSKDTSQTLIMGMNTVTRTSCDFAGNCTSDTVWVDAVVEDTRIKVGVKQDLVTSSTEQQEKKYFEDRAAGRVSADPSYDPGVPETEGYNLTLKTNKGSMEEIFYYTGTNHKKIDPKNRTSLDTSLSLGPVVNIDLQFPVLDDKTGTCTDGKPMWKLMVNSIQVNIYDQIGQFVSNVSVPEFEIDKLDYQQDDGKVLALLEIPKVRNEMRSLEGRRWGDGVYLMNVRVKTSANPINCGLDPANKLSPNVARISKMTKVGYSRVK